MVLSLNFCATCWDSLFNKFNDIVKSQLCSFCIFTLERGCLFCIFTLERGYHKWPLPYRYLVFFFLRVLIITHGSTVFATAKDTVTVPATILSAVQEASESKDVSILIAATSLVKQEFSVKGKVVSVSLQALVQTTIWSINASSNMANLCYVCLFLIKW